MLGACTDCNDCKFDPITPTVKRAMFFYLAMDDGGPNFSGYGRDNINDMMKGATKANLNGGLIYVFTDFRGEDSRIIRISADRNGNGKQEVVKDYGENLDGSAPAVYKMVWNDVNKLVNPDSWVLGFGSHGFGWMPSELHNQFSSRSAAFSAFGTVPETRALIRQDATKFMEMDDFLDVLPDEKVKLMIFDLCFMGGIEFAYALRDKAEYIVFSPAEILLGGMPYDRMIKQIFATTPDVKGICEEYYNFYNNDKPEGSQFATISYVDCAHMNAFAEKMSELLAPKKTQLGTLDLSTLLTFDNYSRHSFFDLGTLINELYPGNSAEKAEFKELLRKLVPYTANTGKPLGSFSIPTDNEDYSGLSTYVPVNAANYAGLTAAYWQTEWAKRIFP